MIFLDATDEILELLTSTAADIHVVVSYADLSSTSYTGGQQETAITSATTTTILASPAASTQRQVKSISIRNAHATTANAITVKFDKAATEKLITPEITLAAGESAHLNSEGTWQTFDTDGALRVTPNVPSATGVFFERRFVGLKEGNGQEGTGRYFLFSLSPGYPAVWVPGTPGLNGRITDGTSVADAGALPYVNGTLGDNYLAKFSANVTAASWLSLIDLIWVNSGLVVTTTTAQAITTPTFSRDANGGSTGEGLRAGLLSTANLGNAAISNSTLDYTNSAGTPGRTGTIVATSTTIQAGTIVPFLLQAGDTGIESIEGVTLGTSYVSGSMSAIVWRDLIALPVAVAASSVINDAAVPLYDDSCIHLMNWPSGTTAVDLAFEVVIEER